MDRQRNDRLGRSWRRRLFEHWRKIRRRWTESDTHANTFSDPNRDSNAHGNCNGNGYRDCNCNAYGDTHGYSELHAQVSTDAAATPDTGTSTVMDAGLATEAFGHGNEVVNP